MCLKLCKCGGVGGCSVLLIVGIILITITTSRVEGTLNVINEDTNETVFSTEEAGIDSASAYGLKGYLMVSSPLDACTVVAPPPPPVVNTSSPSGPQGWLLMAIVHVKDGDNACSLSTKAKNAQIAGYSGIILRRVGANDTDGIIPKFIGFDWIGVKIYACVVDDDVGAFLMEKYAYRPSGPNKYFVRFDNEPYYPLGLLANFVIVGFLAILTVLLLIKLFHYLYFNVTTRVVERRRIRKSLLSESQLRKLPILKWRSGIPQDTCSICIEQFQEGEEIRVLPCSHVFHTLCIDPWLLKESRKCPNCKGRVLFPNERRYHYSSDSDENTESERDERTPLLRRRDENHRFIETLVESQDTRSRAPTTATTPLSPTVSAIKGSKTKTPTALNSAQNKVTFAPSTNLTSASTTSSSQRANTSISSRAQAFVLPMGAKAKPSSNNSRKMKSIARIDHSHNESSSSSSSGGTLIDIPMDDSSDDEMLPVGGRASPCSFTESTESKTLSFHSCNDQLSGGSSSSIAGAGNNGNPEFFYSFSSSENA